MLNHSITKIGVIALAKLLAKILAPNITVNSVAPGFHVTGIYLDNVEVVETVLREENIQIPLNRIGTVEDVVDIVVFLASPASTYITGQCIAVAGGLAK